MGKHDLKRRVLSEARRLLSERGFEGMSIADVAQRLGVSKQAVLHHFTTKDALREAVLAELLSHWGDTLPRLLLDATGGQRRFSAVFKELVDFFLGQPDGARVVLREMLDRPAAARVLLRHHVKPWIESVARFIRSGQRSGTIHSNVDAQAWTLQLLQLALVAAAAHPVTTAALTGAGKSRLSKELGRIAHSSLFRERSTR